MLILFDLSTQEDWNNIMNRMSDANPEEYGPEWENKANFAYPYFVIFVTISSNILMSLFVGVIFLKYNESRDRAEKKENITQEQKDWITM